MIVNELSVSGYGGFKNASFKIAPLQLITGKNGSGKTALMDAISIGLIGYCPWLGNKPALTRGRMSGGLASINLSMDVGTSSVTFPRTGNPVTKKTGEIPQVDPMVIDIAKFFGMTGPQKVRFLLGISTVSVPTEQEVRDAMYEDTYSSHGVPRDEWNKKVSVIFSKLKGPKDSLDWLTELNAEAVNAKQVSAALPPLRETLQRLEAESAITPAAPVADHSVDIAKVDMELDQANRVASEIAGQIQAINNQIRVLRATEDRATKMSLDEPDRVCPTCKGVIKGKIREQAVKESHDAAARNAIEARKKAEENVAALTAKHSEAVGAADVIKMRKAGLRAQQDAYVAFRGKLAQIDGIRLEIMKIEDEAAIFAPIPNWVTRYQARLLDGAMQHVCEIASTIVARRFSGAVTIEDGKFMFVTEDGAKVNLECASGGQRLLATVGIQVALMQRSQFKIVMVDELGLVDTESLESLLLVVDGLLKDGTIHQFIGAHPCLPASCHEESTIAL